VDHSARTTESSLDETNRLFSPSATAAACAGFVLFGALSAFFGPSIPALRSRFALAPAGAGLVLSMFYVGAVTGVLIAGVMQPRTRNNRLLITAFHVMAAGALCFALATNWPCALAASLLCGLGAGGVDGGLNYLFSVGFGKRSPAMLGILNAHYGLGAVAGPLVISLLGARAYPVAFGAVALLLVGASIFLRPVRTTQTRQTPSANAGNRTRSTVLLTLVAAFLAFNALQACVEAGVGAWEPTYLQSVLDRSAAYAANATAGFWLMLTLGRLLVAPITARWSAPAIVTVSCVGSTVCLMLATIHPLAPFAFAGAGLFNAPIFPVALPWLNRSAPSLRWAGTGAVLATNLGGVAAGPVSGLGIERFGVGCVPWLLAAYCAACVVLSLALTRFADRTSQVSGSVLQPAH
jgi:fucose permease